MLKKIAIGGVIAAAIVGAGTASMALTGSTTTPSTPTSGSSSTATATPTPAAKGHRGERWRRIAQRTVHGQFTTRGKDGTFVTHDVIRGAVTAVSPTSITVKAADGTSDSFAVTPTTEVRIRTNGKGAAGTIGQVKDGDTVAVLGTGTSALTATYVIDGVK